MPLGAGPESMYRQEVVTLPHGTAVSCTRTAWWSDATSIDDGLEQLLEAVRQSPSEPSSSSSASSSSSWARASVGTTSRPGSASARGRPAAAPSAGPRGLLGSLEIVREALREWLGPAPLDDDDANDVVLATWEACANAVEHADGRRDARHVFVELVDSSVRIRIQDSGRWVPPVERSDRGLGLELMRAAMTVSASTSTEAGTSVRMEKALSLRHDVGG